MSHTLNYSRDERRDLQRRRRVVEPPGHSVAVGPTVGKRRFAARLNGSGSAGPWVGSTIISFADIGISRQDGDEANPFWM